MHKPTNALARRLLSSTLLLLALVALAACAGSSSSDGGSSSGSVLDDQPRADATVHSLPEETRAWMESALHQFSAGDPRWPEKRAEWLAMGDREADFLVALMWGALLRSQKLAAGELIERARHELAYIGPRAVELMGQILAGGTAMEYYDDIAEETRVLRVDDSARAEAAEVLTIIGEPSVSTLVWVLDAAETKSGRKFAVKSLGDMGDRGGPEAFDALAGVATDEDWVLRVAVVNALRYRSDAASLTLLENALQDAESLVREKAADTLSERLQSSSLPALRAAYDAARSESRLAEAARFGRAISIIEKYGQ